MISSCLLPISGIFVVDSTALKVVFGIFLVANLFVGGSASGAQRMATEGSLTGNQWMMWESDNVIVKNRYLRCKHCDDYDTVRMI